MIRLRNILTVGLFALSLATFGQEAAKKGDQLVWYTNILEANTVAQNTHKPLFAFFTGSDWCGWCRKIQQDVFAKPEFIQWAKQNVVLVELDFPRNKPMSDEIRQQNQGLQQALQVRGYPTIWIFNLTKNQDAQSFEISRLGSLGYPSGAEQGKEQVKFLLEANNILKNTPQ